jgi:hypothetical protein
MRYILLILAVFATLSLTACERKTVATPTPETVVVPPDPAASAGTTGTSGATGTIGGQGTATEMTPPASAPAN